MASCSTLSCRCRLPSTILAGPNHKHSRNQQNTAIKPSSSSKNIVQRRLQGTKLVSCSTLSYRNRLPSTNIQVQIDSDKSSYSKISFFPLPRLACGYILCCRFKGGNLRTRGGYLLWTRYSPKRTPQAPASAFALRPDGKTTAQKPRVRQSSKIKSRSKLKSCLDPNFASSPLNSLNTRNIKRVT